MRTAASKTALVVVINVPPLSAQPVDHGQRNPAHAHTPPPTNSNEIIVRASLIFSCPGQRLAHNARHNTIYAGRFGRSEEEAVRLTSPAWRLGAKALKFKAVR